MEWKIKRDSVRKREIKGNSRVREKSNEISGVRGNDLFNVRIVKTVRLMMRDEQCLVFIECSSYRRIPPFLRIRIHPA